MWTFATQDNNLKYSFQLPLCSPVPKQLRNMFPSLFMWSHCFFPVKQFPTSTCLSLKQDQITAADQVIARHLVVTMIYKLTENQTDPSVKKYRLKNELRLIIAKGLQALLCLGFTSCSSLFCARPLQESSLKIVIKGKK